MRAGWLAKDQIEEGELGIKKTCNHVNRLLIFKLISICWGNTG